MLGKATEEGPEDAEALSYKKWTILCYIRDAPKSSLLWAGEGHPLLNHIVSEQSSDCGHLQGQQQYLPHPSEVREG